METRIDPLTGAATSIDALLRHQPGSCNRELLPRRPGLEGLLEAALEQRVRPSLAVLEHLRVFNADLGNTRALELVEQLAKPGALVVTAGQQPALFGGPLLALHKCVGAALLARQCAETSGRPVVPIFWVHDVDHDLGEANRGLVPAGGDFEKARLPLVHDGRPLADTLLDEACVQRIARWLERLGVAQLADLHASSGESLAHWSTRALLHAAPRQRPVLFASATELSKIARPFLEEAHARRAEIAVAAEEGSRRVLNAGFTAQVDPRGGAQVWMLDQHGVRRPLRDNASYPAGTLSPGVLLRPLVQQWLFPVVAHVNGPAENAYFAQLPPLFEALGLPVPAAIPRPSITWVTPRMQELMQAQGVALEMAARSPEEWPRHTGDGPRLHELSTWLRPRGRPQERAHCWWAVGRSPADELERYDVLDPRPALIVRETDPLTL